MALTGWDQFSVAALKQADPSIPLKIIRIGENNSRSTEPSKKSASAAKASASTCRCRSKRRWQTSARWKLRSCWCSCHRRPEQRAKTHHRSAAKGETSVEFSNPHRPSRRSCRSNHAQERGLRRQPSRAFRSRRTGQVEVLLVDGDPQTSLVQSETFFLTRALNPAGERDSSLFLPTVVLPDGLNAANLDNLPGRRSVQPGDARRRLCHKTAKLSAPRRRPIDFRRR